VAVARVVYLLRHPDPVLPSPIVVSKDRKFNHYLSVYYYFDAAGMAEWPSESIVSRGFVVELLERLAATTSSSTASSIDLTDSLDEEYPS